MHFVLISVLCSVSVAVLLKYAKQVGLDTWQMIVWNYPAAVCLTYFIFQPDLAQVVLPVLPWHIYVPVAIILPSLFLLLTQSLRYAGLVQTEVAQRLSLVLSLLAAVWLFGEVFSLSRVIGILIGFVAIACLVGWRPSQNQSIERQQIFFPVLVFVGYGTIDILFKLVALDRSIPYTTSMFFMFSGSLFLAFIYFLLQCIRARSVFSLRSLSCGLVLGVLNFGNILFYMKAHQALAGSPSVVFTGMNIGVIALGSLLGVWLFREKLSAINYIGIALAMIAVLIIAYL